MSSRITRAWRRQSLAAGTSARNWPSWAEGPVARSLAHRLCRQFHSWKPSWPLHAHWKIFPPLPMFVPSASRQVPALLLLSWNVKPDTAVFALPMKFSHAPLVKVVHGPQLAPRLEMLNAASALHCAWNAHALD